MEHRIVSSKEIAENGNRLDATFYVRPSLRVTFKDEDEAFGKSIGPTRVVLREDAPTPHPVAFREIANLGWFFKPDAVALAEEIGALFVEL